MLLLSAKSVLGTLFGWSGLVKLLFWSTNSARGTLFQWQGLETALLVRGTLIQWPGLDTALLEYKLNTRKALPVACPPNCSFGVQTQHGERSSSGRALKRLFWSTNSVRKTLFQWPGLETAFLDPSFGVQTQYEERCSSGRA